MAEIESNLRWTKAVGITPPQRVLASGETDKPNVVLVIGKGSGNGSGVKTLSASFSYSETNYMDKQQKEVTTTSP